MYLQRDAVLLADVTGELDYGLHPLDLPFDDLVEVLLLDLREGKEVDGTDVGTSSLGDKRPESLVDALGEEGSV